MQQLRDHAIWYCPVLTRSRTLYSRGLSKRPLSRPMTSDNTRGDSEGRSRLCGPSFLFPVPTSHPRPLLARRSGSARAALLPGASPPTPQCTAAPSCRKGHIRAANERVAFRALRRRLGLPAPAALPDAPTVAICVAVGPAPPPPQCPPRNRLRPGAARRRSRRRRRKSSRCVPSPSAQGWGSPGCGVPLPGPRVGARPGGPGLKWLSPPLVAVVRPLRPGARRVSTHAPAAPTQPPNDPRPDLCVLTSFIGS